EAAVVAEAGTDGPCARAHVAGGPVRGAVGAVGAVDAGVVVHVAGVAIAGEGGLPAAGAVGATHGSRGTSGGPPCWPGAASGLPFPAIGFATGGRDRGVASSAGSAAPVAALISATGAGRADRASPRVGPGMVVGTGGAPAAPAGVGFRGAGAGVRS